MSVKGERDTMKRNVLSKVVGGQSMTNDEGPKKLKEYVEKYACKKTDNVKGKEESRKISIMNSKHKQQEKKWLE